MTNYQNRLKIPIEGNNLTQFTTFDDCVIADGYQRIVIGQRGPYIEFNDSNINKSEIFIPEDQEYRVNSDTVYYVEYRSRGKTNVKIYFQKKTVDYADYKVGKWYISPFDILADGKEIIKPMNEVSTVDFPKDLILNDKWEEAIKQIPNDSIDLIVTSPPYNVSLGVGNKHKKDKYESYDDDMPYEDYLDWITNLFVECNRVLKVGGRLCVNIGDGANGSVPTHVDFTYRLLNMIKFVDLSILNKFNFQQFKMMTTIVWDKNQIGSSTAWGSFQSPSQPSFPTQFEFIIVVGKGELKHPGDKSKISISKEDFIKNSRAMWTFPPETQMMKLYDHPACVDAETECLTINGWKKYNEIKIGDLIASLDIENNKMEWQKNIYTTIYNHDGKSITVSGRHIDMNLSHIHRCVTKHNGKYEIKLARDLVGGDKIPCSEKWENQHFVVEQPTIDMAYLTGFFLGDGNYGKRYVSKKSGETKFYQIVISQSLSHNLKKANCVRETLIRLNAEFKEYKSTRKHSYNEIMESEHIAFHINGNVKDEIAKLCMFPLKQVPKDILYWEENTIRAFITGMQDADGCARSNGNIIITQKDCSILDFLQAIGVRLGMDAFIKHTTFRPNGKYGRCGYVEFSNKKIKSLRNKNGSIIKNNKYNGVMWCPCVYKNNTFVARRNGRVFITGNCFPEELPRRLIDHLTYEEDIVLDPFSGAGTTCAVAKKMNRHFIGFEMSKKYWERSKERLSEIPIIKKMEVDGRVIDIPDWLM